MGDIPRYLLLGPVEVTVDGRAVAIERPRQRAILAYLLLHPNRLVTTDRLVEAIWGGSGPSTARRQAQTDVSIVRRVLREAFGRDPVTTRHAGYVIGCGDDQLDTREFATRAAAARRAAVNDPADGAGQLRAALDLWRGEALADVHAAYVESYRAGCEQQRLQAYEDLFDLELALGRHAAIIGELSDLVDANPVHERLAAQLMLALYRNGRPADALRTARRLRGALADQHGLDPGPPLRELEQAILRTDGALDLAGGRPPVTVGAPRPPVPAQLPPDIADFTGRHDERARLDALVPGDGSAVGAVCAIFGAAGVGKTALAVSWGHSVASRFPDGQLYVDMRGYAADPPLPPVEALGRFLRALGMAPERIPTDLDEAAAAYRTMLAARRTLVVVDNAGHAEQVRPLLPAAAGSLCVVTSRSQLGGLVAMNGAKAMTLDPLPTSDAVTLLGLIIGSDRVATDPLAAVDLARGCGHLPLALRIAATHLAMRPGEPVAALVSELRPGDRLDVLAIPEDPHASVRAAFDHTYRSLAPAQRRTFRMLGVAPSIDFSVAAVAALADLPAGRAEAILDDLAVTHLVDRRGNRYTLHDLLREYAAGADGDDVSDDAIDRLLTWYLRNADAAAAMTSVAPVRLGLPDDLAGPALAFADGADALAFLDRERANMVAAIRYAASHRRASVAWLLADLLRGYFRRGMHLNEWVGAARTAIEAAGAAPLEDRARVLAISHLSLGLAYQAAGTRAEAVRHFTAARDAARDGAGWLDVEASAIGNLGVMAWRAGDLPTATDHFGRAVDLARRAGNAGIEANNLGNLAILSRQLDRLDEAVTAYRRLIPLFRTVGAREGEAHATSNLADVLRLLGRADDAMRHAARAADLFREIGDTSEAVALAHLAASHCDQAHYDLAVRIGHTALDIARRAGHRYIEADCHEVLSHARRGTGDHRASLGHAEESMRIAVELDTPDKIAQAHRCLADAHLGSGRVADARTHAAASLALARARDLRLTEREAAAILARTES